MKPIHRDTDSRACGASTIATNHKVTANSLLIAVNGDPNSHGGGALNASSKKVYCGGILVVIHKADSAAPDALCVPIGGAHCGPSTAQGSPNVYAGEG